MNRSLGTRRYPAWRHLPRPAAAPGPRKDFTNKREENDVKKRMLATGLVVAFAVAACEERGISGVHQRLDERSAAVARTFSVNVKESPSPIAARTSREVVSGSAKQGMT